MPLSAVFPSRRGVTPKLRVFLDFLVGTFSALAAELRGSLLVAPEEPAKTVRRRS